MRFGLFYEIGLPDFSKKNELDAYHEALAEIEQADRAGFHSAWVVEHHFMREYSHSSAPEVFLGAASQRTQRIRLGHGIVLLPFVHPIRVAERIATLDILSRGRVEFGIGRGFSRLEYETFGVDPANSRKITDEAMDIILRAWTQPKISHQGEFFRFPELSVIPRPIQKPHPPIWTAAVSPETFDLAAKRGWGVLAGPFKPMMMIVDDHRRFLKACAAAGRTDGADRFGMTIGLLCGRNHEQVRAVSRQSLAFFYNQLLLLTGGMMKNSPASYEYYHQLAVVRDLVADRVTSFEALEESNMAIAGSPEHCIRKLEEVRKQGFGFLLLAMSAGGTPHEMVRESIDLFAREVLPHFA